jgi:hypothetical protein
MSNKSTIGPAILTFHHSWIPRLSQARFRAVFRDIASGEKVMKRIKVSVMLKLLLAALLAVTAVSAVSMAQSGPLTSGTFTLPFAAHWGTLNLQPGSYAFAVNAEGSSYIVNVRQQNGHGVGFVLTSSYNSRNAENLQDSSLLCLRHSGDCSIGALKVPSVGVFYFGVKGVSTSQVVEQKPELIERVPVLYAQK